MLAYAILIFFMIFIVPWATYLIINWGTRGYYNAKRDYKREEENKEENNDVINQ